MHFDQLTVNKINFSLRALTVRYVVLPVIPKETDLVTADMAETHIAGSRVETPAPAKYVQSGTPAYVASTIRP
jgi:hypothetical protein